MACLEGLKVVAVVVVDAVEFFGFGGSNISKSAIAGFELGGDFTAVALEVIEAEEVALPLLLALLCVAVLGFTGSNMLKSGIGFLSAADLVAVPKVVADVAVLLLLVVVPVVAAGLLDVSFELEFFAISASISANGLLGGPFDAIYMIL